jgi:hypothetical protein
LFLRLQQRVERRFGLRTLVSPTAASYSLEKILQLIWIDCQHAHGIRLSNTWYETQPKLVKLHHSTFLF